MSLKYVITVDDSDAQKAFDRVVKKSKETATKVEQDFKKVQQKQVSTEPIIKGRSSTLTDADIAYIKSKEKLSSYERTITETKDKIADLGAAGKENFDKVDKSVEKTTKSTTKTGFSLRNLLALIPGVGLAGVAAFTVEPIIKYIVKLDLLGTKAKEIASLKFASPEYKQAIQETETLSSGIRAAKEGYLSKDRVVKQYNETLGKTTGQLKTFNEVEDFQRKNLGAYLKMIEMKADAQAYLAVATEKATESARRQTVGATVVDYAKSAADLFVKGGFSMKNLKSGANLSALMDAGESKAESNKALAEYRKKIDAANAYAKKNGFNIFGDSGQNEGKSRDSLEAYTNLQQRILDIKAEYSRKTLEKDEEELQKVRDKFKKLADEVDRFNRNPKNKLKVSTEGLDKVRDQAIADLTYEQNTAKLGKELEEQKRLFNDYQSYVKDFGEAAAKERFGGEVNYLDKLREEYQNAQGEIGNISQAAVNDRLAMIETERKVTVTLTQKQKDDELKTALDAAKTYSQKLLDAEKEYQKNVAALGKTASQAQLEQLKKTRDRAVSDITSEEVTGSESWEKLFSNLDEIATSELDKLIKEIDSKFDSLSGSFDPIDLAAIREKLNQARTELISRNPFKAVGLAIKATFSDAAEGAEKTTEQIQTDWKNLGEATAASFAFVNDAIQSADFLKEAIGEVGATAITSLTTIATVSIAVSAAIKTAEKASVILAIIQAALIVVQAVVNVIKSILNAQDKRIEKSISGHRDKVDALENSYTQLERAISKALGTEVFAKQREAIKNLQAQRVEIERMIALEKSKRKTDNGKVRDMESELMGIRNQIEDMLASVMENVTQTTAKELSDQLADALVSAYSKGEDAAIAFGDVTKNVMANAVKNALKLQFLEKPLQAALEKLQGNMGKWQGDNFVFDGLTTDEQNDFKKQVEGIGAGFSQAMKAYQDLFKEAPSAGGGSSVRGITDQVTETTGTAIVGAFNGMRIVQLQLLKVAEGTHLTNSECTEISRQTLSVAMRIEANTFRTAQASDTYLPYLRNISDHTKDSASTLLRAGGKFGY